MLFSDRHDAGRQLAGRLQAYKGAENTIVLGLARGGVVVAAALAKELLLPFNAIVVRKIGAPHNEELALGAVTETGEGIFNEHLIGVLGVSHQYLSKEVEHQKELAQKRLALYRASSSAPDLKKKTVILVDDGIATGASIRAAIRSLRKESVNKLVLAVPVAAPDALDLVRKEVDEIICLFKPVFFEAVGAFYEQFNQTSDEEIIHLLSHQKNVP